MIGVDQTGIQSKRRAAEQVSTAMQKAAAVGNKLVDLTAGLKHEYHNTAHTRDVIAVAMQLAERERISEKDKSLLYIAAAGHDVGFIRQYPKNEPIGADITANMMRAHGYSEKDIQTVKEMITRGTTVPQQPVTLLERILGDADVANLGRTTSQQRNFFELGEALRIETRREVPPSRQFKTEDQDRLAWLEQTRGFLDKFFPEFHTESAQKLFGRNLRRNRIMLDSEIAALKRKLINVQ